MKKSILQTQMDNQTDLTHSVIFYPSSIEMKYVIESVQEEMKTTTFGK